jgi:hypothetical protein
MDANRRGPRRRWLRWGLFAAFLLLAGAGGFWACNFRSSNATSPPRVPVTTAPAGPPLFRDVTADAGIQHTYENGQEAGHMAIPESLGGGVALLDYDGDGLLDVFFTGGGGYDKTDEAYRAELEAAKKDPSKPAVAPRMFGKPCKLYKNLGNWKFKDVTAEAGLDQPLVYSHGVAVADYDRDGWPDLLVTGYARVILYHNEPVDPKDPSKGRHFVDVTAKAGLTDDLWSSSAAWGDLDGDGYPDLYICHYGNWGFDPARGQIHPLFCTYDSKTRDVCPPKQFEALPHRLYRNNGNGTFTDVSKSAGLRGPRTPKDYDELTWLNEKARNDLRAADQAKDYGKGLGVVMVDVNGDGKPDIYVANDTVDNHLYMNRSTLGHIRLEEIGMAAGVARDDKGIPDGSMGVDAADFNNKGRPALWCVNYEAESHALYENQCKEGREFFTFATHVAGIGAIGQQYVGWGTQFFDFDHDGWLDLFISNGHAIRFPKGARRAEKPVLMRNTGAGRFLDVTNQGGPYFQTEHCGRGAAFGDLANDGRIDIVLNHLNEPAVVLRNEVPTEPNHWLGLELAGKDHRNVVGAQVLLDVDGKPQTRYARGGGSYASANDPRHVFGLGRADHLTRLTVRWPSGQEQHWEGLAVDRYWRLVEGEKETQSPTSRK